MMGCLPSKEVGAGAGAGAAEWDDGYVWGGRKRRDRG